MAISKDAVIWGFKFFLARDLLLEKDSHEVIQAHMKLSDENTLAEILICSREFKLKKRYDHLLSIKEKRDIHQENFSQIAFKKTSKIKILFFGNCQIFDLGKFFEAMVPDLHTIQVELTKENVERINKNEYIEAIKDADIIFTHTLQNEQFYKDFIAKNDKYSEKVKYIPRVSFLGYHPDCDYVHNIDNKAVGGSLGAYHSNLAFWGWKNGFDTEETLALFTADIYSHLGYYNYFESAQKSLLSQGVQSGIPLEEMFLKWKKLGSFMHTINHPKSFVLADIARALLKNENIDALPDVEHYLPDNLMNYGCWPVYPEIGRELGIPGSYYFKKPGSIPQMLSLEEFIKTSFEVYKKYGTDNLKSSRLEAKEFKTLKQYLLAKESKMATGLHANSLPERRGENPPYAQTNPYRKLPGTSFWKRSVGSCQSAEIDPVLSPRFTITRDDKVATAGSCFAQHISRRLETEGFNYYIPEFDPSLSKEEQQERNYGVFSARYGNIYTARQLHQLFDRAYGKFLPAEEAWHRSDGSVVDPFRPQVEPTGFMTPYDMEWYRQEHFAHVREMFENLDVFVFTLGLTECWESRIDGAVFPLAPGVAGGKLDLKRHGFKNLTMEEIRDDMELFLTKFQGVNPKARVLLTVSPVPLIATYEDRHVLVSNTYSKSVLRTVADEIIRKYEHCDYFPSYEIITGQHIGNKYLEDDLRSVRQDGVDHVMRVFLRHYTSEAVIIPAKEGVHQLEQKNTIDRINAIICDEEAIDS